MSSKICLASVGVLIAPLLGWLMLPILVCVVGLLPLVLPLAALVMLGARPRSTREAPATSAMRSRPEPLLERRLRLSLVSPPFRALGPSNTVTVDGLCDP
jgi:hypothetical protein